MGTNGQIQQPTIVNPSSPNARLMQEAANARIPAARPVQPAIAAMPSYSGMTPPTPTAPVEKTQQQYTDEATAHLRSLYPKGTFDQPDQVPGIGGTIANTAAQNLSDWKRIATGVPLTMVPGAQQLGAALYPSKITSPLMADTSLSSEKTTPDSTPLKAQPPKAAQVTQEPQAGMPAPADTAVGSPLRITTVGQGVTLGGKVVPAGQQLITNVGTDAAARGGLSPIGADTTPQMGMGNPNLGTAEDNLRQLRNIQALNPPAAVSRPPVQAPVGTAQPDVTSQIARIMDSGMSRANKSTYVNALMGMVNRDSQQAIAARNNEVQMRGQDIGANTALAGQQVQTRGQDIGAETARYGADTNYDLGMKRITATSDEAAKERQMRRDLAAATNETEIKRAELMARGANMKMDAMGNVYYMAKDANGNAVLKMQPSVGMQPPKDQ